MRGAPFPALKLERDPDISSRQRRSTGRAVLGCLECSRFTVAGAERWCTDVCGTENIPLTPRKPLSVEKTAPKTRARM